jgi:hypothetical protein
MEKLHISTLACLLALMWATSLAAEDGESQDPPEDELKEAADKIVPGWEQVGEVYCNPLAKRQTEEIQVELEGSHCYAFIALALKGISDLSLSVFDGNKEVASDRITGRNPTAKWCSAGPGSVLAKLTAYAGSGEFAFGVFVEPSNKPVKADKVGGQSNDLVANRIRQLHSRFGKGRAAISSVFKGNLSETKSTVFKIKLSKGHCYTVIGAGELSVRDLDLNLLDARGRELAGDASASFFASFDTEPCVKKSGEYKIEVRMTSGSGQFGVQVFSD